MDFTRSAFLTGAGALLTAAALSVQAATAVQAQPNIVFIFSDDHSTRAISSYGSDLVPTPNIDRIAKDGALFQNSFVANSICQPSRATVMTGKHSHMNGVIDNTSRWNPNQTIFPKLMEEAGYQTALIGKWHMQPTPVNEFGYSTVLKGAGGQGTFYQPEFINNKGETYTVEGYSADIISDKSIEWLENTRNDDQPFLLKVQYKAPHTPRRPSLEHLETFKDHVFPEPETLHDDYSTRGEHADKAWMELYGMNHEGINAFPPAPTTPERAKIRKDWFASMNQHQRWAHDSWMNRMTEDQRQAWHDAYDDMNAEYWEKIQTKPYKRVYRRLTPEEKMPRTRMMYQRFMKEYAATVVSMDDSIGRILDWLEENDMVDNTIVVYSSDQSFFIGEHGWAEKRYMYEEGLKMPFIIRWPGNIKPGLRPGAMIQNIDYGPTFMEAAGLKAPEEMQGLSFLNVLKSDMTDEQWQEGRSRIYYHYYMQGAHNVPRHDGVRTEDYKLIHFYSENDGKGLFEMYDLNTDPNEMNNIFENPEYKEVRETMMKELEAAREEYEVPEDVYVAPYPYMNAQERKRLGYDS